jgi:hypothetical protein
MPDVYCSQVSTARSCQGKWLAIRLAYNRVDRWQVRLYSDCNRGELSLAEAPAETKLAMLRDLKKTIVRDCPNTKVYLERCTQDVTDTIRWLFKGCKYATERLRNVRFRKTAPRLQVYARALAVRLKGI